MTDEEHRVTRTLEKWWQGFQADLEALKRRSEDLLEVLRQEHASIGGEAPPQRVVLISAPVEPREGERRHRGSP